MEVVRSRKLSCVLMVRMGTCRAGVGGVALSIAIGWLSRNWSIARGIGLSEHHRVSAVSYASTQVLNWHPNLTMFTYYPASSVTIIPFPVARPLRVRLRDYNPHADIKYANDRGGHNRKISLGVDRINRESYTSLVLRRVDTITT